MTRAFSPLVFDQAPLRVRLHGEERAGAIAVTLGRA
jgi:hypothetical protein